MAACAHKIPACITQAAIISGVGPTDSNTDTQKLYRKRRIAIDVARKAPWLLRPLIWLLQNPQRDPEGYFERTVEESSPPDQAILGQPEIRAMLISNWLEGTRQGVRGLAREGIVFAHPWGFHLNEITLPVTIWHGDADTSIPLSMAEYIANAIPNSRLHVIPKEGHFLVFNYWDKILSELVS